jgi:hypothetical protein
MLFYYLVMRRPFCFQSRDFASVAFAVRYRSPSISGLLVLLK